MSTIPILNRFDPLPILRTQNKDKVAPENDDATETETDIEKKSKLDDLFSQKPKKENNGSDLKTE
ncbi:MAG: hypothetical protein QNL62_20560 [Gammaproteobacteria bacterium]|nr:hypothetical protein [Gammaproteobacteria bacterium]